MTFEAIVTIAKEIIIGGAAIVGAVVAWRGLHAWQAQLRGKTEYEVARRVLRGVLVVRDTVAEVRIPLIGSGEFAEAYKSAGKDIPPIPDIDGEALVYQRRLGPLRKARVELHLDLLEAEAIWGRNVPALEDQLNECMGQLLAAVQMHLYNKRRSSPATPKNIEAEEKRSAILYQQSTRLDQDPYLRSIIVVVELFEKFFRPKLTFL